MATKSKASHFCKIIDADYLGGHKLRLTFNDGLKGTIDLSDFVTEGVFTPLQDPNKFIQFGLIYGTIVWKPDREELDIAPEYLYWRVYRSKPRAKWGFDYFSPESYQHA